VTLAPYHGAVSVSGAIADARETYAGWDAPISAKTAILAAEALFVLPDEEVDQVPFSFGAPRLVAVVEVRVLAWELEVSRSGHSRGTLLLRADSGTMLVFSPSAHHGPDDEVPVKIRARNFASDFYSHNDADKQFVADLSEAPVTGGPLLGSTYTPLACDEQPGALPECGQTRLGNRQIVVLDADHQNFYGDNTSHPRIAASAGGEFLVTPPATGDEASPMRDDAALQDYFYRLQAAYSLIDGFHAGKWDSWRDGQSSFPALEYKPRVILAHNTDIPLTCGASQPGCAKFYFPFTEDPMTKEKLYDEHPEADFPAHVWNEGDGNPEVMGFIGTAVDGFKSPGLVFHEFGHIVDLFTSKGIIGKNIPVSGCDKDVLVDGKCVASCVLDSTDEGEALAETIADMFTLFSVGQLYTGIAYTRCDAVSGITSVSGPAHDPACINGPGDIKSFLDQRPTEPGMVDIDGLWFPTGRCGTTPGYRQSGILQAWWEWTHARDCSPTAPFGCDSFSDESAGARSGIEALLFAMSQTNATYYKKLFADMETYLACTDGPAHASRFRSVFCHHGAMDCDALPPVCPAICGNGEAELTEACDGPDLRDQTCFDHGLPGQGLACNPDCTYDLSPCTEDPGTSGGPAPDPTTPTTGSDVPTLGDDSLDPPSSSQATDSEDSVGGTHAEDGCGCRGTGSPGALLALVLLMPRRRRVDKAARAGVR